MALRAIRRTEEEISVENLGSGDGYLASGNEFWAHGGFASRGEVVRGPKTRLFLQ